MKKLFLKLTTLTASLALLAGCGGGSSGSSKSASVKPRPNGQLSGMVTDSVVTNATVDFYRFTEDGKKEFLAESVNTDGQGKFNQSINSPSGYALLVAKGGSYIEEETGKVISLGPQHVLKALTHYQSGKTIEAVPNPWSTIAFGYVECRINQDATVPNAHGESLDLMSSIVGLPVLTTYPTNPTYQDNAYLDVADDGMKFGALAAGISKWTHDEAIAQGVEPHQPGMTSIDLALTMYRDIQADCRLDGFGVRPDGTKYNLAFGKRLLNTNVYRTELPRKMLEFMNSEKNVTRVGSEDLVLYANQQASSTAKLFGSDLPEPLDEQGPFISLSIADGEYVHSNVSFALNAKDISGVIAVKVTFGGQSEIVVDGDNSEVGFSSKNFKDGPLEVVIEAIDGLNNVSTQVITLNVQNTKPIMTLTSGILVKEENYPIKFNVENMPQGIQSAYVNGQELKVDGLFVWGEVPLRQGMNDINITLVDKMGVRHEDATSVFLDLIDPIMDPKVPSTLPEEQFEVLYLPEGAKEPVLRVLKNSPDEGIYVPRDRRLCNGMHLKEEKLRKLGWPYAAIAPKDAGNTPSGKLTDSGLTVTYTYQIGDEIRVKDRLGAVRINGRYFVPFCEEFLGAKWWEVNDRSGAGKLIFNVTDEAGNTNSTSFDFSFSENPTTLEPTLGEDVYFSADSDLITFNATGMEGIDRVELYIDGEYHGNVVDYETGTAHISAEDFKDGLHEAYFVIKDNGKVVFKTEPTKFRIDNTPPKVQLISKPISGTERYVVEFSADDGEGAGFDVTSLIVSNRSLDGKTFKKIVKTDRNTYTVAVDLVPGINPLIFDFKDKVGNEQQMVFDNVGYDASAPILRWDYPNETVKVFGYRAGEESNPIVTQPFFVNGTPLPLYLNEEMVNFVGKDHQDFMHFRLNGVKASRPHLTFTTTDLMDTSEWGTVRTDHLDMRYDVYVDGELTKQVEITEDHFGWDGFIGITREYLGDDFIRSGGKTNITIDVFVKDGVGHESNYKADFAIHFVPSSPVATSFVHSDTTELASAVNINNVETLNRGLQTHELKLTNTRSYPVWILLEDAGIDRINVSNEVGRMANLYREVNLYERALVKGDLLQKGQGYNPNYYMVEKTHSGNDWSSELQVLAGTSNGPLGGVKNSKGRVEKPYAKQYQNPPSNSVSTPELMPVNSHGTITVDKYDQVDSPWCPTEPEFCWEKAGTKTFNVKGFYNGHYLRDDNSVLVRKHTLYEVMPGYPKPELDNQLKAFKPQKSELKIQGSPESIKLGTDDWYLIQPGEFVSATRSIQFNADLNLGDCNWVYEPVKTCLRQVKAQIGGAFNILTRIQTLDGKWGSVVKTAVHQLEPIQLKVSR